MPGPPLCRWPAPVADGMADADPAAFGAENARSFALLVRLLADQAGVVAELTADMTARTGLYRVRLKIPGIRPPLRSRASSSPS